MLTQEKLKQLLHYDPATGRFRWLVNRSRSALAGTEAGTVHPNGYVYVKVLGRSYRAHRLAWLYMTGKWPRRQIDHRNRDRADNRWKNLRLATQSQNIANRGARADNALGVRGVRRHGNKFSAKINVNGKRKYLGLFATVEEAASAYKAEATAAWGDYVCN